MTLYGRKWAESIVRKWVNLNPRVSQMYEYFMRCAEEQGIEKSDIFVFNRIVHLLRTAKIHGKWPILKALAENKIQWPYAYNTFIRVKHPEQVNANTIQPLSIDKEISTTYAQGAGALDPV